MITDVIKDTIKKYNLIQEQDTIVVAVSGGPDSMCLLDNLIKLKGELKIKELIVAHLNHMIRKEANSETEYVKEYCNSKNIRCFIKYVDIEKVALEQKIGTEEAGRNERYKMFDEIAQKVNANKIAIAHNLKDNCETVLMHLLRGSGISGLCGIKPYSQGKYIRPLIKCSREEIEEYCRINNLNPKYDKTNDDNTYTRNKIRNELIPYIQKNFNPNIIETINRLSELITEEELYVEKQVYNIYNEILVSKDINKIILNLKKFNNLDYIIKSKIIMHTIKELFGSTKGIEKKHIEDIIKLCSNNIGNKYLTPNKNTKVFIKNKQIEISVIKNN